MAGTFSAIGTVAGTAFGGPVGGAVGGAIGGAIDSNQAENEAARQKNLEYERQKEFAQNTLQWRVADARAAGLHPLSVIGSSGGAYSPQAVVGSDSGQDIGAAYQRATAAQGDQIIKDLQVQLLREQVRKAGYDADRALMDNQDRLRPKGDQAIDPRFIQGGGTPGGGVGQVQVNPHAVTSSAANDRSTAAGLDVFWQDHYVNRQGQIVKMPSGQLAELLESVAESPFIAAMIAKKNLQSDANWFANNKDWIPFAEKLQGGYDLYRWAHRKRDELVDRLSDPDHWRWATYRSPVHSRHDTRIQLRSPRGPYPPRY